ncbi:MAG TPA: FAD binding domain-containing protein [Dehalococcoidia bacterium]|nr:FAD binding domain-containing protein [Dehalococcoidia bacterium]
MKPVSFVEPADLAGVFVELSSGNGTRLIAGGSDLLGELKEGSAGYSRLVSLAGLDSLRRIERVGGDLRIGALVTISQLETSPELSGPYAFLAEAARGVATPEIRNQGTLGGNLCQRPRCLHYRHALIDCLKKGGQGCPAAETPHQNYLSVFGGPGCYAVNASDLAPPLIALDASVTISSARGNRVMPLSAFFTNPDVDPTRENVLGPDEVLTGVSVPSRASGWRGAYSKSRERTAGDFPIVSLALGYELRDGRMTDVRLVLGGMAPTPLRSLDAESALEGQSPSEAVAATAAEAALIGATPLSNNAFKLDLARALILRGVTRLAS